MSKVTCHAFERLARQNLELRYVILDRREPKRLRIEARDGSKVVANAELHFDDFSLTPQDIKVDPLYRRRGIATAIYVLAEELTGLTVIRAVWDEDRSHEAAAFWSQPDRPFGNLT